VGQGKNLVIDTRFVAGDLARERHADVEERRRERVLPLSVVLPFARFVTSERR